VRLAATERLRGVEDLHDLALTDPNPVVRAAAVNRLTDVDRQAAFGTDALAPISVRLEEELCDLAASDRIDSVQRTMLLERLCVVGSNRSFYRLLALLDRELDRWEHEALVKAVSAIFLRGGLDDAMLLALENSRDRLRRFRERGEWDAAPASAAASASDFEFTRPGAGDRADGWVEFDVPF